MKKPRFIVRAIVVDENRVLVNEHAGYFAFFGGRVEKRESARRALARELQEELGLRAEVGRLLYVVENFFADARGRRIHELGLYYLVQLARGRLSPEKGMAPFWLPLEKAAWSPLRPRLVRERLAADLSLSLAAPPTVIELVEIDRARFPEVA